MSIQEENKLLEQEKQNQIEKDEKINEVLGRREATIAQTIRQVEEKKSDKENLNYTNEELTYINSPYYQNYKQIIDNIEVSQIAANLNQRYVTNQMYFKDPFYDGLSLAFCVNGIGFPIPNRFVNQLRQIIDTKIQSFIQFEESQFKTEITPLKYLSQSENYAKKLDAYLITISLQKTKANIETKTK